MKDREYIQEDEIDLRELFKTIWEKKLFIIIFTLIVTFCSVVYVYIKTPIYEVKSIMEIGFLENKTIDDLELPELYFVVPKLIIIKNEETKELFERDFDEKNYIWNLDSEISEPVIENREISWDDLNRFETNISKEKL